VVRWCDGWGDIDGVRLRHPFLESADRLANRRADLRQAPRAKQDQDNHEQYDQLRHAESKHFHTPNPRNGIGCPQPLSIRNGAQTFLSAATLRQLDHAG